MNLIDTHAHLTYEGLIERIDEVLAHSIEAGVTRWITVGTGKEDNEKVLHLISECENMVGALGYHPHEADSITDADMALLQKQAHHPKVVAIGECGLDYHYMYSSAQNQQCIFRRHLDIAADLQKPVIIHTRQAFDETMDILADYTGKLRGVVIHCYGGDQQQTKLVLDRGYYVSFTGTVTFKNSGDLREVTKTIPLDRLMIETDCPFISPHPKRNVKPNEPALLVYTAQCLADLYGLSFEQFSEIITKTSETFFNLPRLLE